MNLDEYTRIDGTGLAKLVHQREIRPIELRDLAIEAISKVNPIVNAVVDLTPRETADALVRVRGDEVFAGVPFLIKDIGIAYSGVCSEAGSALYAGYSHTYDSELAARQKRAGLVTVGRTNTPEFGNNASTEPKCNGPTRNPWDLGRSPGGSSGGAAAAVSSGMVPIAHASDGGGSIRVPAANCGLFGLKPTRGRNPTGPESDEILFGLVTDHAITRSVRDSAALLDYTAGSDLGSRIALSAPEMPFSLAACRDPRPLSIAYSARATASAGMPSADCAQMIESVATLLTELGHSVFEASPAINLDEVIEVFAVLTSAAAARAVSEIEKSTGRAASRSNLEATTLKAVMFGAELTATDLLRAFDSINRISRSLGKFFASCDLWLSPAQSGPPPLLGFLNADEEHLSVVGWIEKIMSYCPYTAMFNQSGQPAMCVPLYWSGSGLPIGSHFVGPFGSEVILFNLAGQLERARPWADRRPPIHATAHRPEATK